MRRPPPLQQKQKNALFAQASVMWIVLILEFARVRNN